MEARPTHYDDGHSNERGGGGGGLWEGGTGWGNRGGAWRWACCAGRVSVYVCI